MPVCICLASRVARRGNRALDSPFHNFHGFSRHVPPKRCSSGGLCQGPALFLICLISGREVGASESGGTLMLKTTCKYITTSMGGRRCCEVSLKHPLRPATGKEGHGVSNNFLEVGGGGLADVLRFSQRRGDDVFIL